MDVNSETGVITDKERFIRAMADLGDGKFDYVDENSFDDPELAKAFNTMIDRVTGRNNRYLARINDAQSRIGDTSCLKTMFEQIEVQQAVVNSILQAREGLETRDDSLNDTNGEFLALALQVQNSLHPCMDEMRNAKDVLSAIKLPEEDSKEAEANPELWSAIKILKDLVRQSETRLEGIERRVGAMSDDARELFETIDRKSKFNDAFLENVDALTDGYRNLSAECLETGRHLYRISRDIDNARNDMFRHNSKPTLHDTLSVFEVDHVTLAWRLYNNIVEFESLKLTQVNNPTGCKFGIWVQTETRPEIVDSEAFNRLVLAHLELHKKAVECFEAKQEYDIPRALSTFDEVLERLKEFRAAMEDMHVYLRTIGITEETDVWKFRG